MKIGQHTAKDSDRMRQVLKIFKAQVPTPLPPIELTDILDMVTTGGPTMGTGRAW
jgi:hypothetical protein